MRIHRSLTFTAGLIGLQALPVAPAMAAVAIHAVDTNLLPVLQSGAPVEASMQGCASLIEPALSSPGSAMSGAALSKTSAILGGRMSRLEMIAMQQQGGSTASIAEAESHAAKLLPGKGLEPAAGGTRCTGFVSTTLSPVISAPGLGRTPLGKDDFLASKRLLISRTSFDTAWSRVRHSSLPRSMVRDITLSSQGGVSREAIAAVNAWTNRNVRYVEDRDLYGRSDYWASARATLKRRAGDCEDIAIAKMQLLAAMGIPRSDMYLSIARDLARNADHAMLVVRYEGRYLLLDNATDQLLDAAQSYDYRPIMSFNSEAKWLHGY